MTLNKSQGTNVGRSFSRLRRRGRAVAALALSVALLAALGADALAQGRQTGTVCGSVVDAQGLVLPGVSVTVRSTALQGVRSPVTDINGICIQIMALTPGEYNIVFELTGFAVRQRDGDRLAGRRRRRERRHGNRWRHGGDPELSSVVPTPIRDHRRQLEHARRTKSTPCRGAGIRGASRSCSPA